MACRSVGLGERMDHLRRVSLMIDCGNSEGALQLLRNTCFRLVHQRYVRTRLWRQAEKNLGIKAAELPFSLGENELAEFGAYREYADDCFEGSTA